MEKEKEGHKMEKSSLQRQFPIFQLYLSKPCLMYFMSNTI